MQTMGRISVSGGEIRKNHKIKRTEGAVQIALIVLLADPDEQDTKDCSGESAVEQIHAAVHTA